MLFRLTFAALVVVVATASALAANVTLGGVSVNLPTPRGFCELSENSDPSDKRMITTVGDLLTRSGNKLLAMSADCRQLADWRTGNRRLLDDYAQYQTSIALMNQPPAETVAQTCTTLRNEGNKIVSNETPGIKARMESALKNVKMNETSFLGVFAEDDNACYAGLIQKLHIEPDTDKTQISMFAVSIVKNRTLFTYRFTRYQNPQTADAALGGLKTDVAALIAANR
jgi:hypothetical protein